MNVEKTTTGLIIREPTIEIKRKILQYFSLSRPTREYFIYSGNDVTKKPLFGKEHDVIYITSGILGVKDPVIQRELSKYSVTSPPIGKRVDIKMSREPRSDLQRDCIEMMTKSTSNKITVELKPGVGKTFISLYAISKLSLKALVVAPTTLLKNQWVEELMDSGIDRDDIAINIHDAPNKKMCVVTISSLENELRDDWEGLLKVINDSKFGIKITDESHLHLKGLLKLDSVCNIKHNWYLSATLGRSDVSEDNILNRALSDAERFVGNSKYIEYQKEYVNVFLQDIHYNPSAKLCNEYFRYGTKGLIRSTYYNMLMEYQKGVPFLNNIIRVTKLARSLVPYEAKTLILAPLIRTCKAVIELMEKDQYFSKFTCVSVDGSMSISEKRKALESDIIVSTTMSMGTGVDIQNLGSIVNFDQYSSPITNEQVVGRARDRGKEVYYIDICDHVKYAKSFQSWAIKRRMVMPYFPGVSGDFKQLPDIHC